MRVGSNPKVCGIHRKEYDSVLKMKENMSQATTYMNLEDIMLSEISQSQKVKHYIITLIQFSWLTQACLTLFDPMDCNTPGLPVHHQLPEFAQTHVHWVSDAIQPSHLLSSPPLSFSLSQHQGLFQWVSSSHQVAKLLEFQLQHQSFQWIFNTDFL